MTRRTGTGESSGDDQLQITVREHQVLRAICDGKTNQEIANHLRVAVTTIKTYVHWFLVTTECRNRTELCNWAHRTPGMLVNGFTHAPELDKLSHPPPED